MRFGVKYSEVKSLIKAINTVIEENSSKYYYYDRNKISLPLHRIKRGEYYPLSTTGLTHFGIQELKIERKCNIINGMEYVHYNLILVYKPALVLHPDDYYALTDFCEYRDAEEKFNSLIGKINDKLIQFTNSFELPAFDKWIIVRIDYAFQIETNDYLCYWFLFKNYWNNYPPSVYIHKKSTTVNFYDKTYKREGVVKEETAHIIRFEVQCYKKWIENTYNKGRITLNSIEGLWDERVANNVILSKFRSIFGTGDFYTLEEAKSIISDSCSRQKTKILVKFLELTKNDTVDDVVYALSCLLKMEEHKIRRNYLRELSNLGIALVCLPSKDDFCNFITESQAINIPMESIVRLEGQNVRKIVNPIKSKVF